LPCFRVAYAKATWRQTEVSLRPLVCYGRTRASRPPPRQHRDPIRGALSRLRGATLASAFPDCSGAFSVTDRATISQTGFPAWSRAVHLSLAASGHRMSLSILLPRGRGRRHSTAAGCGSLQPLTLEASQSPLIVIADARNPGPSPLLVAEERLPWAWVRWRFPWLSPISPPSHSSSRNPRRCPGLGALPIIG